MALLTGEERTATVVAVTNTLLFEITKENIAGLMSQQPEVSELISKILTERQIMTQSQIHVQRDTPIEEEAIYKRFRERIESFFGLRN
jgi:branched-chain amino acid transport system substrate-binding protein